ncbi:F-box domain, cyclin-like protein [Artemisia annua]|uniref:F-box domain, cyclin-like protein n=1 Tax=Artemisia annua TaxID=35608 RepID=A0A2U1LS43_ARTAN|nr:F-box domain, cyclin-like protein [Artemisia annua]
MEIESKKVRSVVNEDRLSALPDELIHQILSCLDTKCAVQTSLLSSRWNLIWKSMHCLDFSSSEFDNLHKFSKFVTHVLSHRNHQVEVASVKLHFHGAASQAFMRKIANYAFSHNVQELTVVSSCPKKNHEFPPCFFSSQTLKQLSLSFYLFAPCVTPKTPWDFPALTTLDLFDTMLCDDDRESFDPFSKCVNLTNLILRRVTVHAKVFDIIAPQVTKLVLIDCRHSQIVNVIAPQLENLTVTDSPINYMKAPLRLSYLCYSSYSGDLYPQWFKDCFQSLNELHKEKHAQDIINTLQELRSAKRLTLNRGIVECISSHPDLISHIPSPFNNLISLTINSNKTDRPIAHKLKMTTEAREFLLESSPSATFIIEPQHTKAMKAKRAREKKRAKLLADIESDMKELQASVEKENMLFVERKQALESRKAAFENLSAELKLLTKNKMIQSEPESYQIKDVTAGLRTQIRACSGELKGLFDQANEGSIAIFRKKKRIKLYLKDLPKLQRAKLEERYSHQLEEAETLISSLDSTCQDVNTYLIKIMEEHVEDNSENFSTLQDVSSHKLPPASQPKFSSAAILLNFKMLNVRLTYPPPRVSILCHKPEPSTHPGLLMIVKTNWVHARYHEEG